MGFYDCKCMITGVSLKGADAATVLLQHRDGESSPISFAVKGAYNRLGSIDCIEEDEHTQGLVRFFLEAEKNSDFVVHEEYLRTHGTYPFETLEQLLQAFERNIRDNSRAALLHGTPVSFAMIARPIWDEIANSSPLPVELAWSRTSDFRSQKKPQLYSRGDSNLSEHVVEFATVAEFLRANAISWKPAEEASQDYPDDMREYLRLAREKFAKSPMLLTALRDYERQVGDLLVDG